MYAIRGGRVRKLGSRRVEATIFETGRNQRDVQKALRCRNGGCKTGPRGTWDKGWGRFRDVFQGGREAGWGEESLTSRGCLDIGERSLEVESI